MALPDTKVATGIMAELEKAIEDANLKERAHSEATNVLHAAQEELNKGLSKVDELRAKLFNHLGGSDRSRTTS